LFGVFWSIIIERLTFSSSLSKFKINVLLWVSQELACGFPEVFSIGKY